tara:strand:- start:150 stop:341 length:192 start_codon:yes stop_codon:yes gene_type:complete
MESLAEIRVLKQKINDLQILLDDFINLHLSKQNKITNLEVEIENIKQNMNEYLDELDVLINQK